MPGKNEPARRRKSGRRSGKNKPQLYLLKSSEEPESRSGRSFSNGRDDTLRGRGTLRDRFLDLGLGLTLTAAGAYLFYRHPAGLLLGVLILPLTLRIRKAAREEAQKDQIRTEFRLVMQSLAGGVSAGYSAEQAFVQAQEEVEKLYGAEAWFYGKLHRMNQKVRMNEPLDQLFGEVAMETGIEEICHFAEIFRYARRSGGNLAEITRETVRRLEENEEITEEIRTTLTGKRLEQRMMMLLVPGILIFVTLGSPEYAQVLYGNAGGALVMSGCLAGYLVCIFWSSRIVAIRV